MPKTKTAVALPAAMPPAIAGFLRDAKLPIDPKTFVAIDDLDALAERFRAADRMSLAMTLWRGANLAALATERAGEFSDFVRGLGMSRRQAYNYISVYNAIGQLSGPDRVQPAAQMDFSKLVELASWQPEELEAFTKGEVVHGMTLDEAASMSKRELIAREKDWSQRALAADEHIADLERDRAKQKTRIETLEAERLRLSRDRSRVLAEEDLPPFALEARQESIALTDTMGFCLDNLQAVIETNLLGEIKHPEAARWQPIAAGTAYHALAAIHARAGLLLKRLNAEFGDEITGTNLAHALSPAEVSLALSGREQLLAAHKAAAKTREAKRENNQPGKAGRKRNES